MMDDQENIEIAYQNGLRDGIKQGLLRAAEICDKRCGEHWTVSNAPALARAIRAEAEKEGK